MEKQRKILPPEILLEQYRQLLQEGSGVEELPLVISGSSMTPFLVGGRDTVYLSRPAGRLRRGDMALYRRDNGAYVLHRVYRVECEGYTMVGDAQAELEHGIREDQILAVVKRVLRKGKAVEPGCVLWFFFEKVWIRMVPLRRPVMRFYSLLRCKNKTHG